MGGKCVYAEWQVSSEANRCAVGEKHTTLGLAIGRLGGND